MVVQTVFDEQQVADRMAEDVVTPAPSDKVTDRVPDDGSKNSRHDGGGQGDAMFKGQDPTQENGDLPGKEETEEGRGFERRYREDDGQSHPAVKVEDPINDGRKRVHATLFSGLSRVQRKGRPPRELRALFLTLVINSLQNGFER